MNKLQKELTVLLRTNNEILSFIEENSIDGIWYWDIENREKKYGWHNNKFWQTLGYSVSEVKENNITVFDLCNKEDLKRAEINLEKHLTSPEKYPYNENLRYTHKNGHTIWLNVKGVIIYNKNNKPHRLLGLHKCITKQKNAEQTLKDKIQHYENVINGADIGSWECNYKTGEVEYNERWANIFGYTLEELKPLNSKSWIKYIHPNDIDIVNNSFEKSINGIIDSEIEFRMRHKKGHWVWVLSRGKVMLTDFKGNPVVVAGSHYDITERKNNEELLKHYKDLLDRTNEVANIGSWDLDLVSNKLEWSTNTRKIHGVDNDFILNLDSAISFYPEGDNRKEMERNLNLAITKNKTYDFELQIITVQGKLKWVRAIGIPVQEKGKCIRVFGLFQDIDIQKKNEINITLSEKKFRDTFTYAGSGIAILNTNLNLIQVNASFCNIFGYSEKELKKMDLRDLWHPDDSNLNINEITEVILGVKNKFNEEKRHVHKNGNLLWISTTISSIKDDKDSISQYIVQIQNITELKSNEVLLTHYKSLLERTNRVAKIGYWELDFINNKHFWSATTRDIHGVDESYVASLKKGIDFYPEGKNRDLIQKSVSLAINEGKSYDIELQIKTVKGVLKWIRTIGVPIKENNEIIKLYGLIQDIDDRKIIANNLALKEEEFRQTFTEASTGLALISLNGDLIRINKSLCENIGYSKEELLLLSYKDFTLQEDIPESTKLFKQLLSGNIEGYKIEKRYIHKKGHVFWAKVTYSSIRNIHGKLIHYLVQVEDINKRKVAQQQVLDYKNLLEKTNGVAKIGSWELFQDDNEKFFWSPTLKKVLEAPLNYNPTLNEALNFYLEGDSKNKIVEALNKAKNKGENFDLEIQKTTFKGNIIWVRVIGITEFKNNKCVRLYGLLQDVNESKKLEVEIAVREEQFRQTFTHAAIGMALINMKGIISLANPRLCEIVGYSENEIKSAPIFNFSHPEDINEAKIKLIEIIEGKREVFKLEKRYIHKNKNIVWTKISASAVKNDKGNILHIVAQIQDITERKKHQQQILDYKNLLEKSNEVAKIGSWEVSQDETQKVFWSSTLKKILKAPLNHQPTLESSINLYPKGEHRDKIQNAINLALDIGENFDIEIQIKTFENKLIWVRALGITEFENGKCVKLYGLFQDIHEAKMLELEVSLREEQFRQTFWHANVGMTLLNLKGEITNANPFICNMFGYSEEEIIKLTISDASHPDDFELSQKLMEDLKHGIRDNFQIEKRYFHKNGQILWVLLSTSTVKNDLGKISHFVSQIQDITENKRLTENLKEHNNRLLNFAHIVSHNLRSHTGNMTMLLEMNEELNNKAIENEVYKHLKSASNNMHETVNYLSEIVAINTNVEEKIKSVNLSKAVSKTIENVQSLINKHNVLISKNVNNNLFVSVVPAYLDSIILNLVTNAIKYRLENNICKIHITSGLTKKFIYLKVTDNGKGIDLERHGKKLFGMYKTFHEHEDARGVGLFICKNQVEAMGGKIEVISKVNKGSTFIVYFKF